MDRWVFQHPVDPPDENYRGRVLSVLLRITFFVCVFELLICLSLYRERETKLLKYPGGEEIGYPERHPALLSDAYQLKEVCCI